MARAHVSDTLTAACTAFAALKKTLSMETSVRGAERTALTHALACPTCRPIADDMRRAQTADTDRLAAEARTETAREHADILGKAAKVIEANGFFRHYLWDTRQEAAGTPVQNCRVDITGATAIALFGSPCYAGSPRVRAVEQELVDRINAPSLAAWSTYPGNGQTQAVQLIRDTAATLRALEETVPHPAATVTVCFAQCEACQSDQHYD
ncbi:hypothetical protein, partial [Streptomyces sp. NPDC058296]|uniref:DUF6197 family protein n=1 Tax=Streptomyces sp. NPDC058296 TaxID=3346432 RepID=UPI0036EC30C5